jgi:nucleoside-diphosphate-sugar epimerase
MIKGKKILIVGAGGFIGGHLVKRLLDDGNFIVATDIKPKEYWFQDFDTAENYYSMDMKDISNCRKVTKNIDYVFNMACNMGGMGFIENNKAECMQSVLINTNLLIVLQRRRG